MEPTEHPFWKVNKNYFIRTVTHYLTGRLVNITSQELILVDAAWIADTGRYADAIAGAKATLNEVEPYPDGQEVIVGRGAIVDATEWMHKLPRKQV